jgi:hypothetical protein
MATNREVRLAARALRAVILVLGFLPVILPAASGNSPDFGTLAPRAIAWAEQQSSAAALVGHAPTPAQIALARSVGVKEPARIRIQVVDQFPLPEQADVKAAAMRIGLARPSIVGLTLGHSVMLRRGYENDPRLLSHEFRHVAQYEERGGIAQFLTQHLRDLAQFGYDDSPFEVDARAHEVDRHL